jgi:dihydroorotate dehydrogenase
VPVVAAGGITRPADAVQCLHMGAAPFRYAAVLWTNPGMIAEIQAAVALTIED